MAGAKGGKNGASSAGSVNSRRQPRRRTMLNLGIPFIPMDDFADQAEKAMALGYQVLEEVVNEIQAGYQIAKDYNEQRKKAEDGKEPPIPWQKVVDSLQRMNDVTFNAMQKGNAIFLDSVASGMRATTSLADTLAKTRKEVDEQQPKLAGPVFDDAVTIEVIAGRTPQIFEREIRHRGLARLRIRPEVTKLQQLGDKDKKEPEGSLTVKHVEFEPSKESRKPDVSVLRVEVGPIPMGQSAGVYEGQITAKNFDLLIAQLRVVVGASTDTGQFSQAKA
jgi:hypothetical protein